MQKTKKAYTAPALTEHGKVVEATKGLGGKFWETYAPRPTSDIWPDDEEGDLAG